MSSLNHLHKCKSSTPAPDVMMSFQKIDLLRFDFGKAESESVSEKEWEWESEVFVKKETEMKKKCGTRNDFMVILTMVMLMISNLRSKVMVMAMSWLGGLSSYFPSTFFAHKDRLFHTDGEPHFGDDDDDDDDQALLWMMMLMFLLGKCTLTPMWTNWHLMKPSSVLSPLLAF